MNLFLDINTKFKKPNLYATCLLPHLFSEEEMREGAVEPGEHCKKAALDQERINKIKSKLLQHIYKNNVTVKSHTVLPKIILVRLITIIGFPHQD